MSKVYHCLWGWVEETPAFTRCMRCASTKCYENAPSQEQHLEELATSNLFASGSRHFDAFRSPIDDTVISSRREKREHMAKHGVVEYEPSLKKRKRGIA